MKTFLNIDYSHSIDDRIDNNNTLWFVLNFDTIEYELDTEMKAICNKTKAHVVLYCSCETILLTLKMDEHYVEQYYQVSIGLTSC
jgi:hypothetical protein